MLPFHVVAARQLSVAWRLSAAAKCVQFGGSLMSASMRQRRSWGRKVLYHAPLCSTSVSAALQWQQPGRVGHDLLYPGTGSVQNLHFIASLSQDPSIPCVQVFAGVCLFQRSS